MIDRFGDAFLAGEEGPWTAEMLQIEIKEQFGVAIPDDNLGKLMAGIALLTTDNFFRSLPSFLFTVHGLLGDGTDWSYAEPIDLEDLAWAMMEATLLFPPQEEDLFDSQIVAYCKTMVKREGLLAPPSVLTFAKEEEAYGNITPYDENVMQEQADRTNAVNEYIEEQLSLLFQQVASAPSLHTTAETLKTAIMSELEALYVGDKWL
jgi:hypothetical protein